MSDAKKPLLSISMLVSNGRKDTIQKSMESMGRLRELIPSELIIVDTGCTDGTIDIARPYADQVLNFTWCNDFSAARNAGLVACLGEWFLYLDDDEWFENTEEIEKFFASGEYKKYEGAWYIQRNYDSFDGKGYTDTYVGRMSPISDKTIFVGKIHEWISPAPRKIKYLNSYVHHYGYVYKTEEDRQKHILRNLTLVEAAVKEDPTDIRIGCQLVQEYRAAKRYADAEQQCKAVLERQLYPESNFFMQYLITCIPRIHVEMERYEEALEEFIQLENTKVLTNASRYLCMYEKMYLYGVLKEDANLLLEAEKYLVALDSKEEDGEFPVMDFAAYSSELLYQRTVENGIKAMFRLHEYDKALFFFSRIDWKRENNPRSEYIKLLLWCYQETGKVQLLTQVAEKIAQIPSLRMEWLNELEVFLASYAVNEPFAFVVQNMDDFRRKGRMYTDLAKKSSILVPIVRIWLKEMEVRLLSEQMKNLILCKIRDGAKSEAKALFSEVKSMMPNEVWISDLKTELGE